MACVYTLTVNGKVREYGSYQELFTTLIDNKIQIENKNPSDIVFSEFSRRDETVALLEKIHIDKKLTKGVFDGNSGEMREVADNGYISVSDYAEKAKKADGSSFFTPYDENQLRLAMIKQKTDEGKSQADAVQETNDFLEDARRVGEVASNLHAVVREYFKGKKSKEALFNMFGDNFNIEVIEKLIPGLQKIEDYIKQRHGEDAKIVAGLTISSKLVEEREKLLGTIDIVVVDSKGRPHIYQLKGSQKQYGLMLDVRLRKIDYTLAFYRHMLAANGISAKDMTLNVIPARILMNETGIDDIIIQTPEDRTAINDKNGINRLQWGSGEFYQNVNQKVDVQLSVPSTVTSQVAQNVLDKMQQFFPGRHIKTKLYEFEKADFIKKHVIDSTDPSKGAYQFIDVGKKDIIYIKEDSPKEQNAELDRKVEAYLERSREASIDYVRRFYANLENVLKGTARIETLSFKGVEMSSRLVANLGQYIESDWSVVENESLLQLGIVALQNNVTKQIDLIALSAYNGDINGVINLGLGDTMLGAHKKNYATSGNKNLLKATSGNIDLMKVMLALNEMPNWFNGIFKVGKIKILNMKNGTATEASTHEITTTFTLLCRETGVQNNMDKVDFIEPLEYFRQVLMSAVKNNVINSDISNNIYADLERVNVQNAKEVVKILVNAAKQMEKQYPYLKDNIKESINSDNPQVVLYLAILETINAQSGVPFYQPHKVNSVVGSFKTQDIAGGVNATNTTTQEDPNLQLISNITENAFTNIIHEANKLGTDFQRNSVRKLWQAKGYTYAQNSTVGNQNHLYSNMFEVNEATGKLNGMLLFKNPYDPNSKLLPEERVFLKDLLWRINKLRFRLGPNESENSDKVRELKKNKKWYWVPLTEASSASKVQQVKPTEMLERRGKSFLTLVKRAFVRSAEDTYTEEEEKAKRDYLDSNEVFDRFSLSEGTEADRLELLRQYNLDFFERNLDTVYIKFMCAHVRKKHLDLALPKLRAIKLAAIAYSHRTGIDMKTYLEYLDNYIVSNIHNQALLDDELKGFMSIASPIKYLASAAALGFNATLGVRNTLESLWKAPSKIIGKFFGTEDTFGYKEYSQAVMIMIGDTGDFLHNITLIEELNRLFRMQNMDSNRIAQELKSDKSGLLNMKDRLLFWTATAPDYFNRMTMLIAQMIHDGVWGSMEVTDEGFKYNWKKDKRFAAYANNDKSDINKYNEQRALYLYMLREANEEKGLSLKEGDDLPLPYTNQKIMALKNFSDTAYGFYDHSTRPLLQKMAIGSLITQFKSYVTAQRTNWLLKPGFYNSGEIGQLEDEKTGKPLYLKEVQNDDGETILVPTTEVTDIKLIGPKQSYMEGIFYTLKEAYSEWRTNGFQSMMNELNSVTVKKNNIKLAGWNIFVGFLLSFILAALIKMWKDYREEDQTPVTVGSVIGDQVFDTTTRAMLGSTQDFNLIDSIRSNTIDAEPAALNMMSNFFTSTSQFVTGNKTLESYMRTNVGAYRSMYTLFNGLEELGRGVEGSVENEQL